MLQDNNTPLSWLQTWIVTLRWPVIVFAAFWLGRLVQKLEQRLASAETNIVALTERHMPAIHRALAEILGLLEKD